MHGELWNLLARLFDWFARFLDATAPLLMTDAASDSARPLHVAVYGTLMRPFDAQARLGIADQLAFEGPCRFEGALYDLGAFPGAVPDGNDVIDGELFRILDPRAMPKMDRLEHYDPDDEDGSTYVRRVVDLVAPEGQQAWIYWYNAPVDEGRRVPSGSWIEHLEGRSGRGPQGAS
jgi:gamma-glutamylcyclotransferase (GGCT)/AIG2-like uncharacterized protein YtfP